MGYSDLASLPQGGNWPSVAVGRIRFLACMVRAINVQWWRMHVCGGGGGCINALHVLNPIYYITVSHAHLTSCRQLAVHFAEY